MGLYPNPDSLGSLNLDSDSLNKGLQLVPNSHPHVSRCDPFEVRVFKIIDISCNNSKHRDMDGRLSVSSNPLLFVLVSIVRTYIKISLGIPVPFMKYKLS